MPRTYTRIDQSDAVALLSLLRPPHSPAVMGGARESLILGHFGFAAWVVKRFRVKHPACLVAVDDLCGQAHLTLVRVVDRGGYREDAGVDFATYLRGAIESELLVYSMRQVSCLKVSVPGIRAALRSAAGVDPGRHAPLVGAAVAALSRAKIPLNKEEEKYNHLDFEDPRGDPSGAFDAADEVAYLFRRLSPRDASVVASLYGVGGVPVLKLHEAGAAHGMSESRASQIRREAFDLMRLPRRA